MASTLLFNSYEHLYNSLYDFTWFLLASFFEMFKLRKIEGKRRRAWQRIKWLESTVDSMDLNLSKLQETVKNRGAWMLQSIRPQRVRNNLVTE